MSMTRAAASGARRSATRAALKSLRARTRCDWLRLPWIAAALMPSRSSCSASRLAPCLVRGKTRAWAIRPRPAGARGGVGPAAPLDLEGQLAGRDEDEDARQPARRLAGAHGHGRARGRGRGGGLEGRAGGGGG